MKAKQYLILVLLLTGCGAKEIEDVNAIENNPTKIPDYSHYKPEFRVAADGNDYYIEYKSYDMENWSRENTPLPTKEDAQAVIKDCEEECRRRYEKIIGELQK